MNTDKLVLDACCGGRMFWFDKKNPSVLFVDIRKEEKGICPERSEFNVSPDLIADFRKLPFQDKSFKHIVFDPPHAIGLSERSIIAKKYGVLHPETWQSDLKKGFDECWRVLDDYGTLVFKWNEHSVPIKKLMSIFPDKPLYGHPTAKSGKTIWVVFFKNKMEVKSGDNANNDGIPPKDKSLGILPTIL